MRTSFSVLTGAAIAAMLASAGRVMQPTVIENRGQAMPKGAQRAIRDGRAERKGRDRAVAMELQRISNQTLVVSHLHPRWLRDAVNLAMDMGFNVTQADVDAMRAKGPNGRYATDLDAE